ncbi:MAG: hypothetical protein H6917_16550 [Novosphingobium sp.]|nr:hypothetical protein [Novosphingobium sp.]MCP5403984.1 hypothetical protein [Novosphingobium sp.]
MKPMNTAARLGWVASAAALCTAQIVAAAEPDRLICGFENVEDMVALPDSPWIVGSGIGDAFFQKGGLYLFHRETATGRKLVLDVADGVEARAPYDACPGPADPVQFSAHGLGLKSNPDGTYNLYVVNHGGRESIEVFEIAMDDGGPQVGWIGCIISPGKSMPNSVAARPDGSVVMSASYAGDFAVPNFADIAANGMPEASGDMEQVREAMKYGAVFTWSPGAGWKKVPNSALLGNNGIELSADGKWAYVNSWPGASVTHMPLDPGLGKAHEIRLGFHPDNIRYGFNGKLVATGHTASEEAVSVCVMTNNPACALDYKSAEIDPVTYEVTEIFDGTGTRHFGVATIGLRTEDALWLGSVRSHCIAKVDLPAGE